MFPLHAYMSHLRADLDIFIMYFILGLTLVSPQNIIRYFFINSHNMGPANVAFYSGIIALPWSIKPFYGIVSDIIRSYIAREVQIALGYCFSALCFGFAFLLTLPGVFFFFLPSFFLLVATLFKIASWLLEVKEAMVEFKVLAGLFEVLDLSWMHFWCHLHFPC